MNLPHPGDLEGACATGLLFLIASVIAIHVTLKHPRLGVLTMLLCFLLAIGLGWWVNTIWT